MDRDEYFRLHDKINARYQESLKSAIEKIEAKLKAERRRDLEGLKRTWMLDNDAPPPEVAIEDAVREGDADQVVGFVGEASELRSRNDKIRRAVRLVEGDEVTQPMVMAKLEEVFPDAVAGLDPTLISKVLRWLEDHGALTTLSMGSRGNPRRYRKTQDINRY